MIKTDSNEYIIVVKDGIYDLDEIYISEEMTLLTKNIFTVKEYISNFKPKLFFKKNIISTLFNREDNSLSEKDFWFMLENIYEK